MEILGILFVDDHNGGGAPEASSCRSHLFNDDSDPSSLCTKEWEDAEILLAARRLPPILTFFF